MIQRIQTFYLAVALVLMGVIGWLPLAEIAVGDEIYSVTIQGITEMQSDSIVMHAWHLLGMLAIIILLEIFVIFGYKKRIRQMRVATYNLIVMIGFVLVSWLFIRAASNSLGDGIYSLKIPLAFPLVAAILNFLAIRAIGRDEALVRSIDRIR